jgi:hypothetical protein
VYRLSEEVAVVCAGQAADGVHEERAVHLDQLGIADVAFAFQGIGVHLTDFCEAPSVIGRFEHIDVGAIRPDLAGLAAAEDQQDAAAEPDHLGVFAVQAIRVDDALIAGEARARGRAGDDVGLAAAGKCQQECCGCQPSPRGITP